MALKDEFRLPIKCPKCGKKLDKSLGDLQRKKVIQCTCGATIEIKGADAPGRALDKLDKALKDLGAKRKR